MTRRSRHSAPFRWDAAATDAARKAKKTLPQADCFDAASTKRWLSFVGSDWKIWHLAMHVAFLLLYT